MPEHAKILWAAKTWTVKVDYGLGLEFMLSAMDGFQVNPDVTSANFPCPEPYTGTVQYEASICRCMEPASTLEVIEKNDQNRYVPASLEILISAVQQHSDLLDQVPLFAIGSIGKDGFGDPGIPYIDLMVGVPSIRIYSPTGYPPRITDWIWKPAARLVVYSAGRD